VGRLYGFHYIKEWDGRLSRVTVYKKRADLADWLKHGIDDWANILYTDGTMHTIPWAQFESMDQGRFDPNVTDGSGFRYAKKNPRQSDVGMYQSILAHMRALQWLYTTSHWTSSGPNSYRRSR
jgi:hypothetical protein